MLEPKWLKQILAQIDVKTQNSIERKYVSIKYILGIQLTDDLPYF